MAHKIPFPDYVKNLRLALNLSQAGFAGELGISRPYVTLMEAGKRSPSMRVLVRLRKKYGFSIDRMVDLVSEDSIPDL
jgi:transcriptional regulator with XRE-family HTH domain